MTTVVGYLVWRLDHRGQAMSCKIAAEARDYTLVSGNHQDVEDYYAGILAEHTLDHELWKLSLEALARMFPAPATPAPERRLKSVRDA